MTQHTPNPGADPDATGGDLRAMYRTLITTAREICAVDQPVPAPRFDLVLADHDTVSASVTDATINDGYHNATIVRVHVKLDAPAEIPPAPGSDTPGIQTRHAVIYTTHFDRRGVENVWLALNDSEHELRGLPLYDVVTDVIRIDNQRTAPDDLEDEEVGE